MIFVPKSKEAVLMSDEKFIYLLDVVGSVGNKRSGQHEHHHKVDNSVKCLAGFPFDKSRISNIHSHD